MTRSVSTISLAMLSSLALIATNLPGQAKQNGCCAVLESRHFQPRNDAGLMSIKRSFNTTASTYLPGVDCRGEQKACAQTSAIWHKDRFWVLGREGWCCATDPETARKTFISDYTDYGFYIFTREIPLPVDTEDEIDRGSQPINTAPEVRDMSSDRWRFDSGSDKWVAAGGQAVFIGSEEGIHVTRVVSSGPFDREWQLWNEIETANGTKTVAAGDFTNPIRGPGLARLRAFGTPEFPALDVFTGLPFANTANAEGEGYMAVAFDPNGNGGDGSFWVGADDGVVADGDSLLRLGDPRGFDDPTDPATQRTAYGGMYGDTPDERAAKPILEIDLQGNILKTLHNGSLIEDLSNPLYTHWDPDGTRTPGNTGDDGLLASGGEWNVGGLELDPVTGNLWIQSDIDQKIAEVDTVTGDLTGFAQTPYFAHPDRVGGLTLIPDGDPGSHSSFMDLIAFTNRAGDDFFWTHRVHQFSSFNGLTEPRLLTAVNPKVGPQTSVPIRRDYTLTYTAADNIDLLIDETGQGSAGPRKRPDAGLFPALMVLDINAATDTDAHTDFSAMFFPGDSLPEFRVHSYLSDPDFDNRGLQPPYVVPYLLSFPMPTDVVTSLPAPAFVPTGQKIRMQAVYLDSRSQYSSLGLMVTNEAWMAGIGEDQFMIELVGDSSFGVNADGFFRMHYLGGPAIDTIRMSFYDTRTNIDLVDAWFDMDDGPLNGYSGVGRGWDPVAMTLLDLPGCDSTFRQDSDITTGLIYAANYDYPAPLNFNNPVPLYVPGSYAFTGFDSSACDYYTDELGLEFRSGLTGTPDQVGGAIFEDDLEDVVFQFSDFDDPGDVLMWDCDTDGTMPDSAEGHVGLNVTVIFAGGQFETGDLLLDPNGGRVFIGW